MSKIWAAIILISIVVAFVIGNPSAITSSIMTEGRNAVDNVINLVAMICFWSGILKILENTTIMDKLSKVVGNVVLKFFNRKQLTYEAEKSIVLNVTSNILGVGNAATVHGIKAIEEMSKMNNSETPSDNMTKFVLINTASVQLIPATMIALRTMYGSNNPTIIFIPVIIVTVIALTVGLVSISLLNKVVK